MVEERYAYECDDVNSPYNLLSRITQIKHLSEELEEKAEELLLSEGFS